MSSWSFPSLVDCSRAGSSRHCRHAKGQACQPQAAPTSRAASERGTRTPAPACWSGSASAAKPSRSSRAAPAIDRLIVCQVRRRRAISASLAWSGAVPTRVGRAAAGSQSANEARSSHPAIWARVIQPPSRSSEAGTSAASQRSGRQTRWRGNSDPVLRRR
jgi:hypothetical protein